MYEKSSNPQGTKRVTESKNDAVKRRTIELYDMLPLDDVEARKARTDIRDEILKLNYSFFGYVAMHTFINDPYVGYEDKLQSALLSFCRMWWKYRYTPKYRADLSFAVFFRPRIQEEIERELNAVKYSTRRDLCMKVGDQLGKHWGQVKYEDIAKVNLPSQDVEALETIFGVMYPADLDDHEMYIDGDISSDHRSSEWSGLTDQFDSIEDLLIYEMVTEEKKLTDKDLRLLAEINGLDFFELKHLLPFAEQKLYTQLKASQDLAASFE